MSDFVSPVRALVLPLLGEDVLLPSAVVAEVIGYTRPEPLDGAPEWLLGTLEWRGQRVPVVAIEAAMGAQGAGRAEDEGRRARIVVLYGLNSRLAVPYYGVLTQGVPQVYRATGESVRSLGEEAEVPEFALDRVELTDGAVARIPDLDRVQSELARILGSQVGAA